MIPEIDIFTMGFNFLTHHLLLYVSVSLRSDKPFCTLSLKGRTEYIALPPNCLDRSKICLLNLMIND